MITDPFTVGERSCCGDCDQTITDLGAQMDRLNKRNAWHRSVATRRGRKVTELSKLVAVNEELLMKCMTELHERQLGQSTAEKDRDRLRGTLELIAEMLRTGTIDDDSVRLTVSMFKVLESVTRAERTLARQSPMWEALSRFRLALELIAVDPPESADACSACQFLARAGLASGAEALGQEDHDVALGHGGGAVVGGPWEPSDGHGDVGWDLEEEASALNALRLASTTDAAVWATEFCRRIPGTDWGLMVGWFANAIEAGRDAGSQRNVVTDALDVSSDG
jgi:hypothetical protein